MTAVVKPDLVHVRSALFVPGGREGALAKAASLPADMIVVDLEDAVAPDAKRDARAVAADAIRGGFGGGKQVALRINAADTEWHNGDLDLLDGLPVDYVVLPKVNESAAIDALNGRVAVPLIPMIETAAAIYAAREIAAMEPVAAMLAGTNDLALDLGVRAGPNREGLELAFSDALTAREGKALSFVDGRGRALPGREEQRQPPVNGSSVTLTIDAVYQDVLEEELLRGSIDLAVTVSILDTARVWRTRVRSVEYVALCSRDHPLPATADDMFTGRRFVRVSSRGGHVFPLQALVEHGLMPQVALTVEEYATVPAVIVATDLVVLLPRHVADVFSGWFPSLQIAELPWPGHSSPVALYTRREPSLSPAQRWFRKVVLAAVASGEFRDDAP